MSPSGCDAVERESESGFRDDRETSRFLVVERVKAKKRAGLRVQTVAALNGAWVNVFAKASVLRPGHS